LVGDYDAADAFGAGVAVEDVAFLFDILSLAWFAVVGYEL
jgi:hypothetical protein